jgi:hypothetical protein
MKSSLVRLAFSAPLSVPAGAPVFSNSLGEARARARQFFREVRAGRAAPPTSPLIRIHPEYLIPNLSFL